MFTQSKISVDDNIAKEVVKLYRDPSYARGHKYGTWHSPRIRSNTLKSSKLGAAGQVKLVQ